MPPRVRRKLLLVAVAAGVAFLATAGVAAAVNGGFTPQRAHSPNAQSINHAYYLILGFTAVIFVIVESLLVLFVWRYRGRGRPRTAEGAQVYGHTRLEVIWTVIPVVILAIIAGFVFYKLPGIANAPAASNPVRIRVEGHQFYWQFDYPNGSRSIDELHVPVNEVVELTVRSYDVVHSWWIPQLGGKVQAIPGRTNHTWFKADEVGTYYGQCGEFCGIYHESMYARVIASTPADYRRFVTSGAARALGKAEFQGVCATCHGLHGEGAYGPALANNPLLTQPAGFAAIVRNGRGRMPPVGNTWTKQQLAALVAYVHKNVFKGASTGGG
jgi:cytochrome c oxidase subunit II